LVLGKPKFYQGFLWGFLFKKEEGTKRPRLGFGKKLVFPKTRVLLLKKGRGLGPSFKGKEKATERKDY